VGENGIFTHIVGENANFTNQLGENSEGVFADAYHVAVITSNKLAQYWFSTRHVHAL